MLNQIKQTNYYQIIIIYKLLCTQPLIRDNVAWWESKSQGGCRKIGKIPVNENIG